MEAHLVSYQIGGSNPTVVIWSANPIKDISAFETEIETIDPDYIPGGDERLPAACPIILNLEVKDTWAIA